MKSGKKMLTYSEFVKKLASYKPTVYDAYPENKLISGKYWHRGYAVSGLYYQIYKEIAQDVKNDSSILDIGTFPGTFLRLCSKVFFEDLKNRLYGGGLILDEDEENYRNKARQCKQISFINSTLPFKEFFNSENMQFFEIDLDYCFEKTLHIPKEYKHKFDIITCMEVIEHLHTPYKLIHAINYMLKPGGVCVIETNNVVYLLGLIKLLFLNKSNLDFDLARKFDILNYTTKRPHVRFYSIEEISYMLKKSNFTIEKAYSFTWKTQFMNYKNIIRTLLEMVFPGKKSSILIKARKNIEKKTNL